VISSFQPDLAGLGHWTRVRVQSHPPLVRLLREHGLLLLRDWSLLAHASPARMARAWRLHGSAALPAALVVALHGRFRDRYRQERRGAPRSIGRWEPDAAFLVALDPPAPAALTLQRLQAMAAALRRDQLASLPLAADGPEAELRACFWRHYARGLNQRAIGQACDRSCQAKVQRRLQLAAHAAVIATTALGQLAGREGFEAVGRSPERTEAQLAALAEHLLAIPDGGDRSRLALWLSPLLDSSAASSP
jgi:DNA-directed RNA polymerase specialized sigma24 family protein